MRTIVTTGLLIIALLLGAARSEAFMLTEGCCACVLGDLGHSGGLQVAEPALFCDLVIGTEIQTFTSKCEQAGGSTGCFKVVEGESCTTTLAGVSVACPPVAGAPVASGSILATLGAGLAAVGYLVLRRRRAPR